MEAEEGRKELHSLFILEQLAHNDVHHECRCHVCLPLVLHNIGYGLQDVPHPLRLFLGSTMDQEGETGASNARMRELASSSEHNYFFFWHRKTESLTVC